MTAHLKPSHLFPAIGALIAVSGVLLLAGQASARIGADTPPLSIHSIGNSPARPADTSTPISCDVYYSINQTSGAVITDPGTDLVPGSQCDDCGANITLPFSFTLYDQTFTTLVASSNGQLDFGNPADRTYQNSCLPDPFTSYAIFPAWVDLTMEHDNIYCNYYPGYPQNCGIFTSVSGTEPNRVFNIEYRAIDWDTYGPVHFEVRLYENQTQFDIIYAESNLPANQTTSVGVERTDGTFTQYQCPGSQNALVSGLQLSFTYNDPCATPPPIVSDTPTYTPAPPTDTPASTATSAPTNTPTSTFTDVPTGTPTNTMLSTSTPTNTFTTVPTNTPTSTSTAVPGGVVIQGHVLLQGRPSPPSPRWAVPIVGILRLASGGVNYNFSTVTDQSGYFTLNTGLPSGDYLWYVKNPQTLANGGSITLLTGTPNTVEVGTLREGDATNDNCVTAPDFSVLKPAYGKVLGDPGYDARADFNGDNQINVLDFTLLKVSFAACGAPQPVGLTPTATSTITSTPTNTPTALPAVVMVGHITLQGRPAQPNSRQSVPLSVTLHISGGSANQYNATSDQSGFFTITTGLVPGSYTWRVKNAQTLANAGSANLGGSTNSVEMGLLLEGDANDDNCVTGLDFNILRPTFGRSVGDPGYDARADFTGDNQVNASDFNLQRVNFGTCGAAPVLPGR